MRRPAAATVVLGSGAAAAVVLLGLPLVALFVRMPWAGVGSVLARPATLDALRVSLTTSAAAAGVALATGVPLAWALARSRHRAWGAVRLAATLPLVLPPVVGGVALLAAFGPRGLVGAWFEDTFATRLAFSPAGVVLAGSFVALPFVVLTVEAGLRSVDARYDEAAATLGAAPATRFRTVVLPLAGPSLAAGAALAWARALGEFGATVTFAGTLPGRTETLPTSVYLALEQDPAAAMVLSLVLVVVAVAVLAALRGRWLRFERVAP